MKSMGRREYLRAIYDRYHRGSPEQKGAILDEFCRVCDYHRKYAIRLLNGPRPTARPPRRRARGPSYGRQVLAALVLVWEAAGFPMIRPVVDPRCRPRGVDPLFVDPERHRREA